MSAEGSGHDRVGADAAGGQGGSLKARLARLRQSPQPLPVEPPVEPVTTGDAQTPKLGLAERLARLRPRAPQGQMRRGDEQALADALGAEVLAPGLLRLVQERSATEAHGRFLPIAASRQLHELTEAVTGPPETWCFLDTETSGLAGGTGTWVFLFGAARLSSGLRDGALVLEQYLLTRLDAEALMLEQIAESLAATTLLVSYNGKSFDVPLLATRCRLAAMDGTAAIRDLGQRIETLPHLDLLHPVRRAFARRWPDCRLATVEERLLEFERGQDLPGSEAPAAWLDWLRQGDLSRLPGVVEHNRNDLLSLTALIPGLSAAYQEPFAHGADTVAVARHRLRGGQTEQARELLESCIARQDTDREAIWLLAHLYLRAQDWPGAVSLWEQLARENHPGALEALAKFHEHRRRDPHRAIEYARRLPAHPARDHRCQRLQAKLNRVSGWTLDLGSDG